MAAEQRAGAPVATRVRTKHGPDKTVVLELGAVAVAALHVQEDTKGEYSVLVEIHGRNLPAKEVVRQAIGQEPENTHAAEVALHELGFSILVRRRYNSRTGQPVPLSRDRTRGSKA